MEEDIRKYSKKVNKNGKRVRLQKYVFNIDATTFYSGLCPFFWMSVLAAIILPFVALWKEVICPVANKVLDKYDDVYEFFAKKYEVRRERKTEKFNLSQKALEHIPLWPSNRLILKWESERDFYESIEEFLEDASYYFAEINSNLGQKRVALWFEHNNWLVIADQIRKEEKEREEFLAAEKLKKSDRDARLRKISNKVSTVASKVVGPLLILIAIAALYYLVTGIIWLWVNVNLLAMLILIGKILLVVAAIITALVTFAAIIVGIRNLIDYLKDRKSDKEEEVKPQGPKFFHRVGNRLDSGWTFFKETMQMIYKKECPMIEWADKTENIQKR